jgi:hypothetical protein
LTSYRRYVGASPHLIFVMLLPSRNTMIICSRRCPHRCILSLSRSNIIHDCGKTACNQVSTVCYYVVGCVWRYCLECGHDCRMAKGFCHSSGILVGFHGPDVYASALESISVGLFFQCVEHILATQAPKVFFWVRV